MSRSAKTTGSTVNYLRIFERFALIIVWAVLILVFSLLMPTSFFNWGNFAIMFASYAPAALLALAIIVPLTAGDYDLATASNWEARDGIRNRNGEPRLVNGDVFWPTDTGRSSR